MTKIPKRKKKTGNFFFTKKGGILSPSTCDSDTEKILVSLRLNTIHLYYITDKIMTSDLNVSKYTMTSYI